MDIEKLSDRLSASGQVQVTDLTRVKELGFGTLIINRPDHEGGPEQPTSAEIRAGAEELGLEVVYIPVEMGRVEPAQVAAFGQVLDRADTPVLAFCKSGKRVRMLWEHGQVATPCGGLFGRFAGWMKG